MLKSPEMLIPNIAKVGVESSNLFARSSRDWEHGVRSQDRAPFRITDPLANNPQHRDDLSSDGQRTGESSSRKRRGRVAAPR